MKLSKRLSAVVSCVTPGHCVVDVGCDHGYTAIALVENRISPRAIASDVREGPLLQADRNIRSAQLEDRIRTELCDGIPERAVSAFSGTPVTAILSGMGGMLICRILTDASDLLPHIEELVLSPQKDVRAVREIVTEKGYRIRVERFLVEDGKYYTVMQATRIRTGEPLQRLTEAEALYGPELLKKRDPVLLTYLQKRRRTLAGILCGLPSGDAAEARRRELTREHTQIERALSRYRERSLD